METLEEALQEVENIPAYLPNCMQLKDVVLKAKDWLQEVEALQVKKHLNLFVPIIMHLAFMVLVQDVNMLTCASL